MVYDGKDRPQTGDPNADSLSLKKIDDHHAEFTAKKAGKVVNTGTRSISSDGKTMTITTNTITPKGTLTDVQIFEKR